MPIEATAAAAAAAAAAPVVIASASGASESNSTSLLAVETDSATTTQQNLTIAIPAWRAKLPAQLQSKGPKTLQKIRLGRTDIYLLGTAHVSNDSSKDVRLILNSVHPDCIFVELCEARIPLLEGVQEEEEPATNTTTTKRSFLERLKEIQQTQGGGRMQALSTILLTSVQEDYAKELGVELGGEFRCAHAYWKNCTTTAEVQQQQQQRPHLVLGDRPLYLTLVRSWESLGWFSKIKVCAGLLWSSLRKPKKEEIRAWLESVMREESDVLTESFQELRKHFPSLYTTIISERDAWLAAKLTQTCLALSNNAPAGGNERLSMVAIVGAGHVPGICQWLTNQPSDTTKTPEGVLAELVATKRWAKDEYVQLEAIPSWIHDIQELSDNPPLS